MKRISILLFVMLFAFLWMADSAQCKYKYTMINVEEDSSGTVGFNIKDSTDRDTSELYESIRGYDYSNITLEHWASGASAKDSTYATIYVYGAFHDPSDDIDSSWVLMDSILNTDGTSFGVHHMDKLTELKPCDYLKFVVYGIDGKTLPAGINVWIRLRLQYLD